jgi:hypothetical protein
MIFPSETTLSQVLISSFSWIGVVICWELILRPRLARRGIAAALAAEVSRNTHYLHAQLERLKDQGERFPAECRLSTGVFRATASQIGVLPPILVADLVELYHRFDELTGLVALCHSQRSGNNPARNEIQRHGPLESLFAEYAGVTIELSEGLTVLLAKAGAPGWTRRSWAGMTPEQRTWRGKLSVDLDRRTSASLLDHLGRSARFSREE